jgi:hypothetical protein
LKKVGREEAIPCILEPQGDAKVFRRHWARLIQKIYEVDPLVCPKCKGALFRNVVHDLHQAEISGTAYIWFKME